MEAAGWRWSAPYMVVRQSPKPPPTRISLSLAAIAAAREAWVLVTGAGKQTALHDSLTAPDRTSLGRVIAARPTTRIFTDTPVIG
jgi:6-phosphogluconolactonase